MLQRQKSTRVNQVNEEISGYDAEKVTISGEEGKAIKYWVEI